MKKFLESREAEFYLINESRRKVLLQLAKAIKEAKERNNFSEIVFVCTHNSRRSQIAQMLASPSAEYLEISGIGAYFGGTEVTAFYLNSVEALRNVGFKIDKAEENETNPKYRVTYTQNSPPTTAFSKLYSNTINPKEKFIAVMVCAQADENCPFVPGAGARINLPYSDPKAYDNTHEALQKYLETCEIIGRELLFVFKNVK
ncbi:low molecular weight phosphatase family protein [Leptospira broomii]|uniref:hypothetical protein n=1 Tax=Leptospira broomii TaxID=301541 RepID=UPI000287CEAF|nr:hypothetical protein [Leptospira broomii]